MKKIIFATFMLSVMLFAQQSNAQAVSGRINLPGFSLRLGVNDRPYYYGHRERDFRGDEIAMQEARLHDVKRMAWSDGYVSYREREMIAGEQDRLNYLINRNRGYYR